MGIDNNWSMKNELSKKAKEHTCKMKKEFKITIENSLKSSFIIEKEKIPKKENEIGTDTIAVVDIDAVNAIFKYGDYGRTTVLNFSSYTEPGGKFLQGSKAQEECLCHSSFLYNILYKFKPYFYDKNMEKKNRELYQDIAIYSPNVIFFKTENFSPDYRSQRYCDVITCAAPNKNAAQKYCLVSDEENRKVLSDRIEFILQIAEMTKTDNLILGAYGCGVFRQDPEEVASLFKEHLKKYYFKQVIFAIPSGNQNLPSFQKIFS